MRLRASTRSRSSTTAASRFGPSATTSGSRASASPRGRRARPATASSTSTTRTTTGPRSSISSPRAGPGSSSTASSVDAPAGTFVFVRAAAKRTAYAEEAGTTIVAMGATSGKPYEATGWEVWAAIRPIYESGDHAEVVKRLRVVIAEHPEYALLFYNLACCESQIGESAGGDRASPPRGRDVGSVPRVREGRLGLRPDPRRARLQGARRRLRLFPIASGCAGESR